MNNSFFISSIRDDIPSGGRSATTVILSIISPDLSIPVEKCFPNLMAKNAFGLLLKKICNAIMYIPGVFFLLLHFLTKNTIYEYLIRLSFVKVICYMYIGFVQKPSVVYFNHHSTFLYSFCFPFSKRIFIIHDLLSRKEKNCKEGKGARGCLLKLESLLLKRSNLCICLSRQELIFVRRFYKKSVLLAPVVKENCKQYYERIVEADCYTFVGNWKRPENYEGVISFFEYISTLKSSDISKKVKFEIAGYYSQEFVERIIYEFVSNEKMIEVVSIPYFSTYYDLHGKAIIAPILSGAGIKLKTIEAWSVNMPVLGTKQAFSGLSPALWRKGGIKFSSINEIVDFIMAGDNDLITDALHPFFAYEEYLSETSMTLACESFI